MIHWFSQLNLHLKIAIILAPLLGIVGFGLADLWLGQQQLEESPQARPVAMHELTLNGRCALVASSCMLSADGINVMLKSPVEQDGALVRVDIGASGHIRGLQLALVQGASEAQLVAQRTTQTDRWFVEFPRSILQQPVFTLRLALAQTKRVYLAEFAARLE